MNSHVLRDSPTILAASPMIYLLNTPVLTAFGYYRFLGPLDPADARGRLVGGFQSAIGNRESAVFLSSLLGFDVPVSRVAIAMQPGDFALVLRLRGRLPEGRSLSADEMRGFPFELGWLERITRSDDRITDPATTEVVPQVKLCSTEDPWTTPAPPSTAA